MIWELIYKHLETAGLKVFSPGQHKGVCTEKYVVVKDTGSSRMTTISTDLYTYDIMCYVPQEHFSQLEPFVAEVKAIMKTLYPTVKATGLQTAAFLDDTNQAHMVSIQYTNYKKITNFID